MLSLSKGYLRGFPNGSTPYLVLVETQDVLLFVCFFGLAFESKPMLTKCTMKREVSKVARVETKEFLEK